MLIFLSLCSNMVLGINWIKVTGHFVVFSYTVSCKEETNIAVASMMTCKIGFIWRHMKPYGITHNQRIKKWRTYRSAYPTHHVVRRAAHCISIMIRGCNARIEGLHDAVRTHTRTILPRRLVFLFVCFAKLVSYDVTWNPLLRYHA